ncbi:MAG: Type 1 glutamine amidotransferase-like domain-containing protein [Candidatus Paceibacterota bacterium]
MKIILASDLSFLLKYGYNLTGISKSEMKIGYITTASKVSRSNKDFFENIKIKIRESGYFFEEMDIEGKNKEELRGFFKDKNIIQIEGGNTFYLLKVIRETGFDEILKELLNEGKVYMGTSAGSYVMCPTIEVSTWNDDGKDKFGVTDFTALNYVPFVLKAHYKDTSGDLIKEKTKTLKYPLHILRDGQGIFCENGVCKFVGEGEEVKF